MHRFFFKTLVAKLRIKHSSKQCNVYGLYTAFHWGMKERNSTLTLVSYRLQEASLTLSS